MNHQIDRFSAWLDKVGTILEGGREIWCMGDYNLDLDRRNDNTYNRKNLATLAFEELMGRGLAQMIEGPTHRRQESESTIDMIFTNEPRKIETSGKIATGTEHDCVWILHKSKFVPVKQEMVKRNFKNFNEEVVLDEARKMNWNFEGLLSSDEQELNNRVEELEQKISYLIDEHAPIQKVKVDPAKIVWMTDNLRRQINK